MDYYAEQRLTKLLQKMLCLFLIFVAIAGLYTSAFKDYDTRVHMSKEGIVTSIIADEAGDYVITLSEWVVYVANSDIANSLEVGDKCYFSWKPSGKIVQRKVITRAYCDKHYDTIE